MTYLPVAYKVLKELKQAVQNYAPQSPFVLSLLNAISAENLLPVDWKNICKTVLEGSQWLQLKSWWYEEATLQARRNATSQPPGPVESEPNWDRTPCHFKGSGWSLKSSFDSSKIYCVESMDEN